MYLFRLIKETHRFLVKQLDGGLAANPPLPYNLRGNDESKFESCLTDMNLLTLLPLIN